jgi:hypothetical protein
MSQITPLVIAEQFINQYDHYKEYGTPDGPIFDSTQVQYLTNFVVENPTAMRNFLTQVPCFVINVLTQRGTLEENIIEALLLLQTAMYSFLTSVITLSQEVVTSKFDAFNQSEQEEPDWNEVFGNLEFEITETTIPDLFFKSKSKKDTS